MSDELLCDPCQRFLMGENPLLNQRDGYLIFSHHTTSESFQQGLALPCRMCRRLRAEFRREIHRQSDSGFEVAPTTYILPPHPAGEKLRFRFKCSRIKITLFLNPREDAEQYRHSIPALSRDALADKSLSADYTGSDACIDFVLSQFMQCRDTHITCQSMRLSKRKMDGFLPTRMIDVGHIGDSAVCLVESDDRAGETLYIALSHCWGDSQPLRLTQSTATRLRAGVLLTELPKTFQDAILVTRSMRIRYLWIDSLCIIQDNPQDWHREAACMQNVYSWAICCIAATAAKNGDIGLFLDRAPEGLVPLELNTNKTRIYGRKTDEPLLAYVMHGKILAPGDAIDNAPLNQRAWVAQERYLSTRIIHFTQELLFWECRETITSEQDPDGHFMSIKRGGYASNALKSTIYDYKIQLANASGGPSNVDWREILSEIYRDWSHFRNQYSVLCLTKEEDILVALNGIAQTVAEATKDTLVAGLWRNRMIEELCWRRDAILEVPSDAPPRPSIWRAPTWSWASINRAVVSHCYWWERKSTSGMMNEMAVLKDITVNQKSSGKVVDASVTLTCRLMPMYPPNSVSWEWVPYKINVVLDDCTITNARDLGDEVSMVVLRHRGSRTEGEGSVQGLLVTPSRLKAGSYERVGYFDFNFTPESDSDSDDSGDFDKERSVLQSILDGFQNAQEKTIELI